MGQVDSGIDGADDHAGAVTLDVTVSGNEISIFGTAVDVFSGGGGGTLNVTVHGSGFTAGSTVTLQLGWPDGSTSSLGVPP